MGEFSSFGILLYIYIFICTKLKKITIVHFFSLDACSRPKWGQSFFQPRVSGHRVDAYGDGEDYVNKHDVDDQLMRVDDLDQLQVFELGDKVSSNPG